MSLFHTLSLAGRPAASGHRGLPASISLGGRGHNGFGGETVFDLSRVGSTSRELGEITASAAAIQNCSKSVLHSSHAFSTCCSAPAVRNLPPRGGAKGRRARGAMAPHLRLAPPGPPFGFHGKIKIGISFLYSYTCNSHCFQGVNTVQSDTFNCAFQFPVDSTTAIAE